MGIDYTNRNGWYFNANVSGTLLLGRAHELAGASLSADSVAIGPRPPFVAEGEVCHVNAAKIAAVRDEQLAALLADRDAQDCWGASPGEFTAWVRAWQAFLADCAACGGYDTDPSWELAPGVERREWPRDSSKRCGSCDHFDPCFVDKYGSAHCALIAEGKVNERQTCALRPSRYRRHVPVALAPLGAICDGCRQYNWFHWAEKGKKP